jgi:uncharacterized protein YjdB
MKRVYTILLLIFLGQNGAVHAQNVSWEIFKNKTSCDFNVLKTMDSIPDEIVKVDSMNTPNYSTGMDRFASRIKGYIIAPVNGDYSFYFACDDIGQFWLSPDTSTANAVLKSNIDSVSTDWNLNVSNQALVAGNKYFFEILHYDTVYTDMIKLGWKIPGDTIPILLRAPYITSSGDQISVGSFSLIDTAKTVYPNWTIRARSIISPWNTTNKNILWRSSNNSIATVNSQGAITAITPGVCQIIAKAAQDTTLSDTLQLSVIDYYGPYFVKPDSMASGDGHSWDNAIGLTKLLDILNQGQLQQMITIYAAEGTYKPTNTIDRNQTFLLNNIRLMGGFEVSSIGTDTTQRDFINNETIFSGDIGEIGNSIDNTYHVVTTRGSVIIDGVTIRDGRASCSTYGYTPGVSFYKREDHGAGIFIEATNNYFLNCNIINNSSWSEGGAIYSRGISYSSPVTVHLENSFIRYNTIQQVAINSGSMFVIYVNANGAGIATYYYPVIYHINKCLFYNNSAHGYGASIYVRGSSSANIKNSSFYNNSGVNDICGWDGGQIIMGNSTVKGSVAAFHSYVKISNSTIYGSGFYESNPGQKITLDNVIWTNPDWNITDTAKISAKYSIIKDTLCGINNFDLVATNLPNSSLWLDTLANNGGNTPTMKLKNSAFNPAKSFGNPIYLDSLDQRGAIRSDSVSIGAYQWVKVSGVEILNDSIKLCLSDSAEIFARISPQFASNTDYSFSTTDTTIAIIQNNTVKPVSAGNTTLICVTADGAFSDTVTVTVVGNIGSGSITGDSIACQGDNPVIYTVSPITHATSYLWTLPNGATGESETNSIAVNYGLSAVSGNITVKGVNSCGEGAISTLPITVNEKPATPLITNIGNNILQSSAVNGNQWFNQDGIINGATNQNYTASANGSYFVIVSTNCNSDTSNIIQVTNTGVTANNAESGFSIYPNPATNQITLSGIETGGTLRLYDLTGKLLLERVNRENTLDLRGIAAGSYVLEVRNESGPDSYRVVRGSVVVE